MDRTTHVIDGELGEVLSDLGCAVDRLAVVDTAVLSGDDLLQGLVSLHRLSSGLRHATLRLTAAFDTRRAWADDGSKTAAARLGRECRASKQTVGRLVRHARRLRAMPLVATALAAGEIGEDHFDVLSRLAGSSRPSVAAAFPEAERLLVTFATTLEFPEFVARVRYWEQVVDEVRHGTGRWQGAGSAVLGAGGL